MPEQHQLMGGKLHVYKRENSSSWQCSTFLGGRNRRKSTGEESLAHAKDFAEDWYLELRGKFRAGVLKDGKRFREVANQFLREYKVITLGQRHPRHVRRHEDILRLYLIPYFGDKTIEEITPGEVQEYRVHRANNGYRGKPPSRSTLHHETVTLRQVLKTAHRHGWLKAVPDLSPPYKTSGKITHRAWFSPAEYKQLYEATRHRAKAPPKARWKWQCEQMHDYVLFMANTGLRPDEAKNLQHRDVSIVTDDATSEKLLEIEVRGKRGIGYCKSMPGAVRPYERLLGRALPNAAEDHKTDDALKFPQPTDRVFPGTQRELFNAILNEEGLKIDRDSNRRTAYSLRHTYICLRLMEGADIYQIAKNCRTSVEMIETYYASHIKNTLDAAAINVRRPRKKTGEVKPADDS
jgi:integrase